MLTINSVSDFVYENCDKVSVSKNGEHFHTRCPLCGDSSKSRSKKRFHIEYTDDNCKYHCFNCSETGDFYKLYSILKNVSRKQAWKEYHVYNSKQIKQHIKSEKIQSKKNTKDLQKIINISWIKNNCLSTNDIPTGYIQQNYINILKKFISDRKISIPVFIAYRGRYKDRIIIPIYDGDDIVYFQGRTINNNDTKYLNPSIDKSLIVFNKGNFVKSEPVFITEGILDAQSIGNNGTCCLGKSITDKFLDIIYKYTKDIYIVLDNDEDGKASLKSLMKTSKHRQNLKYFVMPYAFQHIKDINELLNTYDNININEFIIDNSYSLGNVISKLKWGEKINEIDDNWNRRNSGK